jgi:hypothetical protein
MPPYSPTTPFLRCISNFNIVSHVLFTERSFGMLEDTHLRMDLVATKVY